ncbi:D-alanyl-D-alanine carboxypeptidase family protein [Bacillus sp. AFS041924]|uniref:D-alanyl-D-alanine carboxypeptidase family protein n=1 Tax=Bacillus sp. AFS041924 TaxID=2033503 RepID=UPI000BFB5C93|nr:D-alanyl-D-alanine carboxypeptidase family protein [Bacillus sp. AFS041924]PGS47559.1 D-alanyl-D-alanine carboxypeptidase [Bacillus sp. AFS041924]
MRKMKKWLVIGIIGLFLIGIIIPTNNVKAFGGVSARNAVLMDQKTGRILYGKAMHDSERIASITKIMTALLAVESGKMQNTVTISSRAVQTEGSSIYLKPGQKIKLEDLVYGLMLRSGNDAANAIAETVGGSIEGFVYMMNEKAKEIGMSHTYFSNPSGLDQQGKEHYSSAYDMALLTRYAMENPKYAKIAGTKVHRAPNTAESWDYVWKNKNKLLTFMYKYSTGGKTGFTKKARRTLVSTASKNGMDLIVVTLNDGQDWQDHMSLFEYGFSNYPLTKVLSKGGIKEVTNQKYKGHVYLKNDFSYPLEKKEKDQVRITIEMQKPSNKKIANDAIVGKAIIELEGEQIGFRNIFYSSSKVKVFTKEIIQNSKQVLLNLMGEHSDG